MEVDKRILIHSGSRPASASAAAAPPIDPARRQQPVPGLPGGRFLTCFGSGRRPDSQRWIPLCRFGPLGHAQPAGPSHVRAPDDEAAHHTGIPGCPGARQANGHLLRQGLPGWGLVCPGEVGCAEVARGGVGWGGVGWGGHTSRAVP
jgi:hypothetical protein